MYCKNCGSELVENSSKCPKCDMRLDVTQNIENKDINQTIRAIPTFNKNKRLIFVFLSILVTISLIIFIININSPNDFASARWGMSKEKVINIEKEKGNIKYEEEYDDLIDTLDVIVYENITVNDENAKVEYYFKDNKLVKGTYWFNDTYNLKIDKFTEIITNKYGKPSESDGKSGDSYYKWTNKRTNIDLQYYKNATKGFTIFYGSKVYNDNWLKNIDKKSETRGL